MLAELNISTGNSTSNMATVPLKKNFHAIREVLWVYNVH